MLPNPKLVCDGDSDQILDQNLLKFAYYCKTTIKWARDCKWIWAWHQVKKATNASFAKSREWTFACGNVFISSITAVFSIGLKATSRIVTSARFACNRWTHKAFCQLIRWYKNELEIKYKTQAKYNSSAFLRLKTVPYPAKPYRLIRAWSSQGSRA